jgi:quercetin dioxygenase-like cupin family protein
MLKRLAVFASLAALAFAGAPSAQQPAASPIKRTVLQKMDVANTNLETIAMVAEVAPGALVGRHTHPGIETGYLLEGDTTVFLDGKAPQALKAGDSWQIAAGAPHDVRAGDKGAKVFLVYVVEKGKPLVSAAN